MVNTKLIITGIIVIVFMFLISTIYVQKSVIKKLDIEIATCQDVNAKNKLTTEKLHDDIKNGNKLCEERLQVQNNTIRKLKQIDEIKKEIKNENSTEYPLLNALNSMFTSNNTN